ncbi:ankyrin repeat domain-containing protein [bacterium]|nr:ankyrin repeat domain-containing protein [bacterium]MBU3954999.1 ankyrin repeat domain-containing protein [bacterium]
MIKYKKLKGCARRTAAALFVICNFLFLIPPASAESISASVLKKNDVKRLAREIKKKADVNERDWFGRTPLMKAARFNAAESAALLIKNGAEINAVDKNGWTALMWASIECSSSAVKLLIDMGADVTVCDNLGYTALMFAENKECAEISAMLKEALKRTAVINTRNKGGKVK